jgi:hypothetical protein
VSSHGAMGRRRNRGCKKRGVWFSRSGRVLCAMPDAPCQSSRHWSMLWLSAAKLGSAPRSDRLTLIVAFTILDIIAVLVPYGGMKRYAHHREDDN